MNRLAAALIAYVILGVLTWLTITDRADSRGDAGDSAAVRGKELAAAQGRDASRQRE